MKNCKQIALVTGASSGIGRAAVILLVKAGFQVYATARNQQNLESLQKECDAISRGSCLIRSGDAGDEQFIDDLIHEIETETRNENKSAELLINNAGIAWYGLLQDMSISEWDRIIRTNLTSVFLTCRGMIPLFLKNKRGSIVNVSSVWGSCGASCEAAYSATKGGVNALTKALAKELGPSGIRVNAAAFGVIDTKMNSHLSEEELRDLMDEIPQGRFGSAEEAARLILDLGTRNPYLNGQIVTLDGGWI